VRSQEEYEKEHIPDALNIPIQDLKNSVKQLDNAYQYVTTCGKGGGRSSEGAAILKTWVLMPFGSAEEQINGSVFMYNHTNVQNIAIPG
jgi:hypothetical protein